MSALATEIVLAAGASEEFVPPTDWRAQIAVPVAILLFFGSVYLLLRSSLGTKRAYLVEAAAFFGFMLLMSLFWTFGAPGTPTATGPTYLPGQPSSAYQPTWTPFAPTSSIAQTPTYGAVQQFPQGFGPVPESLRASGEGDESGPLQSGIDEIRSFFASEEGGSVLEDSWAPVPDGVQATRAENGYPILAVTYQETFQPDSQGNLPEGVDRSQVGEVDPEGESVTLFGFYDAGSPLFPSFVFVGLSLAGLLIHLGLLARDENRLRREAEEVAEPEAEPERVGAGA
jgi:hypothetical protein